MTDLNVVITARDGASAVFAKVGNSAKTMGDAVETAGNNASTAATNLDSVGTSASSLTEKFESAGLAITAIGGALVYSGQQAMEHERLIIAVTAAYGTAADEMIAFANSLSDITIFSDEDILAGERFFATLRNNYGLTLEEIQQLMVVTADLASATGITFEDASNRVAAAIRGEAEAAELLGLTMNQQAIDREGLTLAMSNQEAAQFRLNILLDQSSIYQGTAKAVADSSIGTYASLTNTLQDMAVTVGNFIGPWGSLITGFGTAAIGISGTIGAFTKLGGALSSSRLALAALPLVMNPLTLGFGALAAGAVFLFTQMGEGQKTVSELNLSFQDLNKSVDNLKVQGLDVQAGYLDQFVTDLETIQGRANELINDDDYLTDAVNNLVRQGHSIEDAVEMVDGALLLDNKEQFESDIADITAAMSDPRIDQEQLSGVLAMYRKEFELTNNLELYAERLNYTANNLSNYTRDAEAATEANAALGDSFSMVGELATLAAGGVSRLTEDMVAAQEEARQMVAELLAFGGMDDPLSLFNIAGLGDVSTQIAQALATVTTALETTYRIIVSNTDAMGQTAQATEDWVLSLTDASDGLSQLQALREQGVITDQEYLNVLGAQQTILEQNAIVQQEILGIQATQAPVLAELVTQQAAYLQIIGDMPAQQQLIALGWMDSATAAQAYEATTLAAAAANGEFGESGRLMVEQMIQGAVAANPVLGEMLEQMGLISIGADGTITIHFDSVTGAMSEMERLTMSIDALTIALGGIPPLHVEIDGSVVEADSLMAGVLLTANALDGTIAQIAVTADTGQADASLAQTSATHSAIDGDTSTVHVDGDNSDAVNSIAVAQAHLAALQGARAMIYVDGDNSGAMAAINSVAQFAGRSLGTATFDIVTRYTTIGSGPSPFRHGGIPGYAHGGVVAELAEAGPELLHFANGGVMPVFDRGLYGVPPGTYVSPNNAFNYGGVSLTINHYGSGDRNEMNRWAEDELLPQMERAFARRGVGMGVM